MELLPSTQAPVKKKRKISKSLLRVVTDDDEVNETEREDEEMMGEEKKYPVRRSDCDTIVDLSTKSSSNPMLARRILIGGGWSVERGMISFTSGNTVANYEAFTITKSNAGEGKKEKKDISINMPIRLLPQVTDAIQRFKMGRENLTMPEAEDILEEAKGMDIMVSGKEEFDLSQLSQHDMPKINFKIDELFYLLGEAIDFGKGLYDVLSFVRKAKEEEGKTKKKDFSLSIPARYLNVLSLAMQMLAEEC